MAHLSFFNTLNITNVSRGTLHIACNHTSTQMFHVEQRNKLLTIFNKEIFKNIWNLTKKFVSLQC